MKTMAISQYGTPDEFHAQERPRPVPRSNEVLVEVHASSVNYGDLVARDFSRLKAREFNMPGLLWFAAKAAFGFKTPRTTVLGSEFSGRVEAVGSAVTALREGDLVFGHTGPALGAYAEFLCLSAQGATLKPAKMSHEEAATVPYGATTALALLRPMKLGAGQSLLVLGASGAIGSGKFRSVVDKVYPLENVADAHRYVEGGGRQGVIAIKVK